MQNVALKEALEVTREAARTERYVGFFIRDLSKDLTYLLAETTLVLAFSEELRVGLAARSVLSPWLESIAGFSLRMKEGALREKDWKDFRRVVDGAFECIDLLREALLEAGCARRQRA